MNADLTKIWSILTPRERKNSVVMTVLVVLMAFSETVGVILIMPSLSVLARLEVIHEVPALQWVYAQLSRTDERTFIVVLGFVSIGLVVGSSVFKTLTLHAVNRFTFLLRHSISTRLLSRYLEQPYEFFLNHNPFQLACNVLSEVDQLHGGLVKPLSQLIAHGAVVLAMVSLLFLYNSWGAVGALALVTVLYGSIYILVRKRLGTTGRSRQIEHAARLKACNEVLNRTKAACPNCLDVRMQALMYSCNLTAAEATDEWVEEVIDVANLGRINDTVVDQLLNIHKIIQADACRPIGFSDLISLIDALSLSAKMNLQAYGAKIHFVRAMAAQELGDSQKVWSSLALAEAIVTEALPVLQYQVYYALEQDDVPRAASAIQRRTSNSAMAAQMPLGPPAVMQGEVDAAIKEMQQ